MPFQNLPMKSYVAPYPTLTTAWLAVDFAPHKKLKHPVTLADVKANTNLKDMALVRLGRLSVQPVTDSEWEEVMKMSLGK